MSENLSALFGLGGIIIQKPERDSKIREEIKGLKKEDFLIFLMKNGQLEFGDDLPEKRHGEIVKTYVCKQLINKQDMKCEICSFSMSELVQELFALPSVASDCRPWSSGRSVQICSGCGVMKRVTNSEFNHDVYKDYTSYPEPEGRTKKILEFLKDKIPKVYSVLDIGTGTGDGLQILQDQFPLANVYGYEPTIHKERPKRKYDLITLFHVLEHVEDLHEMLSYIKLSLTDGGHVLIQVPYALMWPFDLVIADHVWHFNATSLIILFNKAGFKIKYIGHECIKKELTLLAVSDSEENVKFNVCASDEGREVIGWLLNFKKNLGNINKPVAVYGTGPAAAWAGNILGDKVICYVDDDNNRQQKLFNGKRVGTPFQCDLPMVAPFPDWQLEIIKAKNPSLKFL